MASHEHQAQARHHLRVGIITASDTRTAATDKSGAAIRQMLEAAGHTVPSYEVIPDERARISAAIAASLPELDAIIVTGGTGVARRDATIEAVEPMLEKKLDGFGEIFRMLSYQEIGAAAILSRAVAGICRGKFIAAIPGSTAACRLAMEKLILPEIGHIAYLLAE
ncbi:MAG TPA: molybdenum cofactor biosynthesis protein B [Candidatus Binataceae bacterium]|nr:molybdenum cofactor biosynthesis protein B [Candidatus Binataceae bacterium]